MKYNIEIIQYDIRIEEIIKKIDRSQFPIAILIDNKQCFYSIVDVYQLRRFLISGGSSTELVKNIVEPSGVFINKQDITNKDILKSIQNDLILGQKFFCPILDENKKVIDVFSLDDIVSLKDKKGRNNELNYVIAKRILVIGGGGYLGSVLVRYLLAKGYFVRILDNFIFGKESILELNNKKNIEIVEGDIRDIEIVVSAIDNIDAVILLAAVVGDPASKIRPKQTIETNLLAAQAIATAAKNQQINRFLYASTCSVYGFGEEILSENSPLNPVSLYARTKINSEDIIRNLGNGAFSPTILRMSTLYGFSPRMRFDLVVNTMTLNAFLNSNITVFGGEQWRPLLNVMDAADAFVKCLESPIDIVGNQTYNIGSEDFNYKIIDIGKMVLDTLKDQNIKIEILKRDVDARDYRVSFSKIRDHIGFIPQNTIIESIKEIYSKLINGQINNPQARRYYNLYFDSSEEI